jgi:hypothetical protein
MNPREAFGEPGSAGGLTFFVAFLLHQSNLLKQDGPQTSEDDTRGLREERR